uniref:Malonyl-coenzyme A:anthocyanin 3-O-glucoside-6''-O-malonyltransferase-like n=1 Tax=Tanacetum cinerariifolium TaxID=118510 RepID=A0A6L2MJ23_TANCI|nr:malonyl-coenzyme A:anthocyanin 3-O-glucoside-6''-O-malonyltransferase-like [Tanacetum cinerariifolium]
MPEIRYVEGDCVAVTFAECNLDFNDLSGSHPRKCDKFYPLIPLLGSTNKVNDYITLPVFAVQVTLFPNYGISIGMTNHHSLCDASTRFCFMKAWTTIARSGGLNDQSLLKNETFPLYERVVQYPNLDQSYLKTAKVENFNEAYQLPRLSGPIACAYMWNCMVKLHNKDEIALFVFAIDCRSRMNPPIPATYFGNCLTSCMTTTRTNLINGKEGFVTAAKLIGENLNKILTDKNGVVKDIVPFADLFPDGMPTMKMGVTGNPKLKFYDLDFGFGKPKKHETVSIDYQYGSISMSASKESNEDMEIANNSVFRGFFEKQKLTGPNFIDWYRQLRIVLSIEDELNYLEQPIPPAPVAPAGQQVAPEILAAHNVWIKGSKEIELLQTTRDFHSCRKEEGQSVSSYVLKMKGYIENLKRLGHPVTLGLVVSLILIGLRKEYDGFMQNYNMYSMGKTVNEFHAMLKLHKQTLPKNNAHTLNAIRAGKVQKGNKHKKSQTQMAARGQNHGKGKNKQAYAPKPKIPPPPKRKDPAKDSICHECASRAGGSGIFVIELNTILNRSWIYDTGCGTHICNTTQGLKASRKQKLGALRLYVENGQREAVEAIGAFYLCLPSGLEIVLNNCHYAPSITRGVISVSRLNNVVYFSAIPRDGIFEIDLSNSLTNKSSIYAVSNKRSKLDLDSALLWHCRLGHISKKRIEKLQHNGLLDSSDFRAFEKCVSYMSGKMAREPYTHQVERAKDLLGLIHTDHKHEVFKTFKVFQKEVENQLSKTIKVLRSDRGGEYMSQEFFYHLKDHRIIAHRTPPYTPQHNGVSERKNRTLLDMVEKTPYEVWKGKAPKLSYLKVSGCEALVKRDTLTKPDKLELRSIKCIFVGYPKKTMGYSFYYPPENKVLVARNAEFPENSLINQEASGSLEDLEIIQEEDTHHSIETSLNHEEDDLKIDEPQRDLGEPGNYKAAFLDLESEKWLNAMNVEMQSVKENEVWILVELPPNGKTVDIRAIRILIAIAAYYDYEIWQMNVKTAFLNGYLNEKVYMEQPKGFVNPKYPNREKHKLNKSQGASTPAELKRMQNVSYASAVGSIMYAVRCTRPDVAFAQNLTSQFQQNPGDIHWTTVKNILMYLRNTKDMFLVYRGDLKRELKVSCYTDAGYLTGADDLKSQTGYVFILNGGVVDWKSAKQSIFATSSVEAEYIAAFDASKEAVWVRKFISRLGVVLTIKEPISMYCDNTGGFAIANESGITKVLDISVPKFTTFEKLLNMVI